jgi:hypothetical protein
MWSHKKTSKFSLFKDSYRMGASVVNMWFKEILNKNNLLFIIISVLFFSGCLFLLGSNPAADEGTHNLLGLFFFNFINDWIKYPTLSFNKIYDYTMSYLVYYPKLSLYYPPLFHIILSFTYRVFEISSTTGDLTTLFFSVGAGTLMYLFSKNFLKNPKIGLVSALIFFLSPMILRLSVKTLTDIPTLFFFFSSIYIYFLSLKTNKTKYFVVSSFVFSLAFLTKWNTALALPIILLYTLLEQRESLKKLILSFILIGVLLSPYILLAYKAGFLLLPLKSSLVEAGYNEGDPQYTSIGGWLYYPLKLSEKYFTFPIFILSLFSLTLYSKNREKHWKLFLVWFLVCYLFFTWLPNKDPRYILLIIPPLIIPLSRLILSTPQIIKIPLLFFICVFLLVSSYMHLKPFMYVTDFPSVVDEVTKEDGNILLASETNWFYSSSFMFNLASTNNIPEKKVFRPCILDDYNISEILQNEGIRYVIITDPSYEMYEKNIEIVKETSSLVLLKTIGKTNKIMIYNNTKYHTTDSKCNYVCLLEDWICSNYTIPNEVLK